MDLRSSSSTTSVTGLMRNPSLELIDTNASTKPLQESQRQRDGGESATQPLKYKVYKRRFFGLAQLVLLNIVINWDWLTFSAVSQTSAQYYGVSEDAINWLSIVYLFAFCVASPVVIYTLNHGGPKQSMIAASGLTLVGNWIRYAGTRASPPIFGLVIFGQILIGLAQPFVLAAPTRYSDLWFSDRGRTSATALATLANPFGAALGQLIDSIWTNQPSDIPNMVLYISILSSVASIPSIFLPAGPPSPPTSSAAIEKTPLAEAFWKLVSTPEFWLIWIPFAVYVGFFNSISSLLNQILSPYGYSETQAGIAGGILIIVGLIAAAIVSPITDRFKHYLGSIRMLVPIISVAYIGLVFAPSSPAGIVPSFVVCALLGASSFSILPLVLEYLVEITYPFPPEIGSTLCWTGGQLFGAVFIIIQSALKADATATPPSNMQHALIFSAVLAVAAAPFPLSLGRFGRNVGRRRLEIDVTAGRSP
ncbi:hypothetical protein Egran_01953 [Elaphomyces granulatus]|uniref:Major facilitator superfamily (MFS) profile domain-containing protein n=1 Tax=Elaphomyces granulatus TaxID=519963 RepID=A0A232M1N7_9EURO|nr:hypothetical protein Egran_01953 [Elaphomyces granulatus]